MLIENEYINLHEFYIKLFIKRNVNIWVHKEMRLKIMIFPGDSGKIFLSCKLGCKTERILEFDTEMWFDTI